MSEMLGACEKTGGGQVCARRGGPRAKKVIAVEVLAHMRKLPCQAPEPGAWHPAYLSKGTPLAPALERART